MRWQWGTFDSLSRAELYAALCLRERVFVVEQECAYQECDGRDPAALHLLGWRQERLVAYLRVFPPGMLREEAVIGRVLVARRARGEGRGAELMAEGLRRIQAAWGPAPVWLSAQAHLEAWYRALGFRRAGSGYDEDGIPHVPMCRVQSARGRPMKREDEIKTQIIHKMTWLAPVDHVDLLPLQGVAEGTCCFVEGSDGEGEEEIWAFQAGVWVRTDQL